MVTEAAEDEELQWYRAVGEKDKDDDDVVEIEYWFRPIAFVISISLPLPLRLSLSTVSRYNTVSTRYTAVSHSILLVSAFYCWILVRHQSSCLVRPSELTTGVTLVPVPTFFGQSDLTVYMYPWFRFWE